MCKPPRSVETADLIAGLRQTDPAEMRDHVDEVTDCRIENLAGWPFSLKKYSLTNDVVTR